MYFLFLFLFFCFFFKFQAFPDIVLQFLSFSYNYCHFLSYYFMLFLFCHFLPFSIMFFLFVFLFLVFFSFFLLFFLFVFFLFLFVGGSKSVFLGPQIHYDFPSHFLKKKFNFSARLGRYTFESYFPFLFALFPVISQKIRIFKRSRAPYSTNKWLPEQGTAEAPLYPLLNQAARGNLPGETISCTPQARQTPKCLPDTSDCQIPGARRKIVRWGHIRQ